jgi:hypothetical protein
MNNTNENQLGTLRLIKNAWHFVPNSSVQDILPIHPIDNELAEKVNASTDYTNVEAYIVDEFTHPEFFIHFAWGAGIKCWKIVPPSNL